jgi:hypothetical protein
LRLVGAVDWTLLALALAVVVAAPKSLSGDGYTRYLTLERYVMTGHLVSERYSVVGPLLSTPLYLIGSVLGAALRMTLLFNVLLFSAALVIIWRELRDEIAPATRRALLLLLVFASMFAHHLQRYYGEVLTSLAVTVGVLWLSRGRWARGWAAILLGAVNTPASLIGIAAIALRHARRTRSWLPLLGPVVACVLVSLESLLVRGGLFATGYVGTSGFRTALPYSGRQDFSYPFLFGVLAIFLSFGKGLVFFAPGMFLPLQPAAPPRIRWIQTTLIAFVLGLVITYAKWWAWYGGWFWGPRFFLIASVPACFSLAMNLVECPSATLLRRGLVAIALLLSFWVGVNGLVFQSAGLEVCTQKNYELEAFCHYVPEMSVLWHPFVDGAASQSPAQRLFAFMAVGLWSIAIAWLGRALFADLARRGLRALVEWRTWW